MECTFVRDKKNKKRNYVLLGSALKTERVADRDSSVLPTAQKLRWEDREASPRF